MKSSIQLTKELKVFAKNQEIDIFGISGVEIINARARKGRRPRDLYPSAKSVLIFGCGMAYCPIGEKKHLGIEKKNK